MGGNNDMDSRERVRRAFRRELPDRPAFNFWMDRDMLAEYERELGPEFRVTHFGADVIEVFPDVAWWKGLERQARAASGSVWQTTPLVGSLTEALHARLPDVTATRIYEPITRMREKHPGAAIFVNMLSPLDTVLPLRLYEGLFMDMHDSPDQLDFLLSKVAESVGELCERVCQMDIDALYLMGDVAMKSGPMMSRAHLDRFCFRPMTACIEAAKRHGKPVLYHTDGAVMDILDMLVDYGIDGINPLQPHLNDLRLFGDRWAEKLVLYGGLDNSYIIPDGTPQDVIDHVNAVFRDVGGHHSLIFSTHDIPNYTPRKNIEAMVEAIKSCR